MSDHKKVVDFISEAQETGARRGKARDLIGINFWTLKCWSRDLPDDGRPMMAVLLKIKSIAAMHFQKKKEAVVAKACLPDYCDLSPGQIVPILSEKGRYPATEAAIYRLLKCEGMQIHRSRAKAPACSKPDELIAAGPNQVWTWVISYLRTRIRGMYFLWSI